jgi:hypothetical protein
MHVRNSPKWTWLLTGALLFPFCAVGCSMTFRDAVAAGAFDFVAGTVTDLLARLLPIAEAVAPA